MDELLFNTQEYKHPSDGWYQIEAKGEHLNRAAEVIQVIDDSGAQSIVNRFNAKAAAGKFRNGNQMLLDHDHFSHFEDKETIAYGWVTKLQNRDDGIYAQIRWTGVGQKAVDGGEYRFFSTEYNGADLQILDGGKPRRARPMELDGLSLTNRHNNRGQKPITNREKKVVLRVSSQPDQPDQREQRIPTEDLERWFNAVRSILKAASKGTGHNMGFHAAWNLCKQQHPDLYAAAFPYDVSPADSSADTESTTDDVTNIANRIKAVSGRNFEFAWAFVRDQMPRIFNRQRGKSALVLNREKENRDSRAVQAKAAKLFGRLANQEQLATKSDFAVAWQRITNREPALHLLASGKCTADEAFAKDPALRNRLQ